MDSFRELVKYLEQYLPKQVIYLLLLLMLGLLTTPFWKLNFEEPTICSPQGLQGLCYNISENICEETWERFAKQCFDDVQKKTGPFRPGEMIGPKILQCQRIKYDKILYYNRQNSQDERCRSLFQTIEEDKRLY